MFTIQRTLTIKYLYLFKSLNFFDISNSTNLILSKSLMLKIAWRTLEKKKSTTCLYFYFTWILWVYDYSIILNCKD